MYQYNSHCYEIFLHSQGDGICDCEVTNKLGCSYIASLFVCLNINYISVPQSIYYVSFSSLVSRTHSPASHCDVVVDSPYRGWGLGTDSTQDLHINQSPDLCRHAWHRPSLLPGSTLAFLIYTTNHKSRIIIMWE